MIWGKSVQGFRGRGVFPTHVGVNFNIEARGWIVREGIGIPFAILPSLPSRVSVQMRQGLLDAQMSARVHLSGRMFRDSFLIALNREHPFGSCGFVITAVVRLTLA